MNPNPATGGNSQDNANLVDANPSSTLLSTAGMPATTAEQLVLGLFATLLKDGMADSERIRIEKCIILLYVDVRLNLDEGVTLNQANVALHLANLKCFRTLNKKTQELELCSQEQVSKLMRSIFPKRGGLRKRNLWLQKGSGCIDDKITVDLDYYEYYKYLDAFMSTLRGDPCPQFPPPPQISNTASEKSSLKPTSSSEHSKSPIKGRNSLPDQKVTTRLRKSSPNQAVQPFSPSRSASKDDIHPKLPKRSRNDRCTSPEQQRRVRHRSAPSMGASAAMISMEQPNLLRPADVAATAPSYDDSATGPTEEVAMKGTNDPDTMFNDVEMDTVGNNLPVPSSTTRAPVYRQEFRTSKDDCNDIYHELKSNVIGYLKMRGFDCSNSNASFAKHKNCPDDLMSLYCGITGGGQGMLGKQSQIHSNCSAIQLFFALMSQFLLVHVFQASLDWLETYDKFVRKVRQSFGDEGYEIGDNLLDNRRMNMDTLLRETYYERCKNNEWLYVQVQKKVRTYAQDLAHLIDCHLTHQAPHASTKTSDASNPTSVALMDDLADGFVESITKAFKMRCMLSASPSEYDFLWYAPGEKADRRKMEYRDGDQVVLTTFPGIASRDGKVIYKAQVDCIETASVDNEG